MSPSLKLKIPPGLWDLLRGDFSSSLGAEIAEKKREPISGPNTSTMPARSCGVSRLSSEHFRINQSFGRVSNKIKPPHVQLPDGQGCQNLHVPSPTTALLQMRGADLLEPGVVHALNDAEALFRVLGWAQKYHALQSGLLPKAKAGPCAACPPTDCTCPQRNCFYGLAKIVFTNTFTFAPTHIGHRTCFFGIVLELIFFLGVCVRKKTNCEKPPPPFP